MPRPPTEKQKKLAQLIVENSKLDKPLNKGEMVEKVGYGPSIVETPAKAIDTDGVKEALHDLGFTENNAKKVVSEIMMNEEVSPNDRLKATDQVFKVSGSYEADKNQGNKTLVLNIMSKLSDDELLKIARGQEDSSSEGVSEEKV